ncbi:hypothetical protein A2159_03715 [Candidatus Woesebacteria bacterium RBG_13_34_9]|uniref:Uncharacterized protein n=1 Tax=Candidatus Woesebacteria bacterium RBG_13_34_9 TaxID=1802477 RepID=A0A1F7X2M5_9BACT|nr:MAG: hypothetical protein A2159_03715 [Candidatus Woesebacteria bacterium RBG_13_34_9]
MIIKILFSIIIIFIAIYLFWKRLKEDYISSQIFTTFFYILFGVIFFTILSDNFYPKYWFWFGLLGLISGLSLAIYRFKLRLYETIESVVISFLLILSGVLIFNWFLTSDKYSLGYGIINLLLFILFYIFDKHYKKFNWYKSGRVGFSGLAILGIFFLIRIVIASGVGDMISFLGRIDAILSGIISFISFLALYNLSKKLS